MDLYWKSAAAALICVILSLSLGKHESHLSLLLSILMCCMIGAVIVSFLVPVIELILQLESISGFGKNTVNVLLKVVGISFIGEVVSLVCSDTGNSAMAKMVGFLTNSTILWLSIPVINQFVSLLRQIIGV